MVVIFVSWGQAIDSQGILLMVVGSALVGFFVQKVLPNQSHVQKDITVAGKALSYLLESAMLDGFAQVKH